MNVIFTPKTLHIHNVYNGKKVVNNIIPDSYFYNIFYANSLHHLNNIFIKLTLRNASIQEYFNKYKCIFNTHTNKEAVECITNIERHIMGLFSNETSITLKLKEQMQMGEIKLNSLPLTTNGFKRQTLSTSIKNTTITVMLKISGVWESETEKGIIFKFLA